MSEKLFEVEVPLPALVAAVRAVAPHAPTHKDAGEQSLVLVRPAPDALWLGARGPQTWAVARVPYATAVLSSVRGASPFVADCRDLMAGVRLLNLDVDLARVEVTDTTVTFLEGGGLFEGRSAGLPIHPPSEGFPDLVGHFGTHLTREVVALRPVVSSGFLTDDFALWKASAKAYGHDVLITEALSPSSLLVRVGENFMGAWSVLERDPMSKSDEVLHWRRTLPTPLLDRVEGAS